MIFALLGGIGFSQTFCGVQVENEQPIERGFISSYLAQKVQELLLETGWVRDCKKGKPVKVIVKSAQYKGASISGNRFSGYTFKLSFEVLLPKRSYSYSVSKYISLPDPSLGTLKVRYALEDIMDLYELKIKRDLLQYTKEFGK